MQYWIEEIHSIQFHVSAIYFDDVKYHYARSAQLTSNEASITDFSLTLISVKTELQQRTCVGQAVNDTVHKTLQQPTS